MALTGLEPVTWRRSNVKTLHGRRSCVHFHPIYFFSAYFVRNRFGFYQLHRANPKKDYFNVPELLPAKSENDNECQFERALQVIFVDDLAEWLTTTDRRSFCLKKKSEGYWVIYAINEMKNIMSAN